MFSSESLSSSGTESENERMIDFGLQPYSLEPRKSKAPVGYGCNSMSDLANNINAATNDVDGRIGNRTWCKCQCCPLMETSIDSVYSLEFPEFCKPRFSERFCLYVCRSDPHFIPQHFCKKNPWNILISTHIWSLRNQNKSFISIQNSSYFFKYFTLHLLFIKDVVLGIYFFKRAKIRFRVFLIIWKVISYCLNLQKQPFAVTQKAFKYRWALRDTSSWEFEKIFTTSIFLSTSEVLPQNISEIKSSAS